MSAATLVAVGVLGGAGAVARWLLTEAVAARRGRALPWGTLAVNVLGALALGVLAGAAVRDSAYDVLATGFLGAFTTFSTWMVESDRLAAAGRRGPAAAYVAASLALGLLAVWAGRELGALL